MEELNGLILSWTLLSTQRWPLNTLKKQNKIYFWNVQYFRSVFSLTIKSSSYQEIKILFFLTQIIKLLKAKATIFSMVQYQWPFTQTRFQLKFWRKKKVKTWFTKNHIWYSITFISISIILFKNQFYLKINFIPTIFIFEIL